MGQRITNNFTKRFGSRVRIIYRDKPLKSFEQKLQNEVLAKAVTQVLAGILKRDPTIEELLGVVEIKNIKIKPKR